MRLILAKALQLVTIINDLHRHTLLQGSPRRLAAPLLAHDGAASHTSDLRFGNSTEATWMRCKQWLCCDLLLIETLVDERETNARHQVCNALSDDFVIVLAVGPMNDGKEYDVFRKDIQMIMFGKLHESTGEQGNEFVGVDKIPVTCDSGSPRFGGNVMKVSSFRQHQKSKTVVTGSHSHQGFVKVRYQLNALKTRCGIDQVCDPLQRSEPKRLAVHPLKYVAHGIIRNVGQTYGLVRTVRETIRREKGLHVVRSRCQNDAMGGMTPAVTAPAPLLLLARLTATSTRRPSTILTSDGRGTFHFGIAKDTVRPRLGERGRETPVGRIALDVEESRLLLLLVGLGGP
mmetsp:Transcript_25464/g.56616  ORF Transcript_25464/g.56616 Transcript_25464/m.56616 type:complete len:345 (+) Transcript_25464:342-1376(+)